MYKLGIFLFVFFMACRKDRTNDSGLLGEAERQADFYKKDTAIETAISYTPDQQLCSDLQEMSAVLQKASANEKFRGDSAEFEQLKGALDDMNNVACK